jgi:hypothetical protein
MSTDLGWLLEEKIAQSWSTPARRHDEFSRRTGQGGEVVKVCWWPVRWPVTSLFFGPHAMFPFRPGIPDDASSEIRAYVRGNFEDGAALAGWLPLEELLLPLWTTETVMLETKMPASYASAFGSGSVLRQQIEERLGGCDAFHHLMNHHEPQRVVACQDWSNSRAHELFTLDPDCLVPVTWKEPLSEYVGPELWSSLQKLSGLEPASAYRLVTCIG